VTGASDVPAAVERQLIVFSLHGEHYGLPIGGVREIIRYTPPRVTATARGLTKGLINLRGQVLPVVDLSGRLGQVLEVTDATRILVIDVAGGVVGLLVDRVDGVVHVAADRIEPIPGAVTEDALGEEIAAIDDRLVMLIDPERALGRVLPEAPAPRTDAPEPTRAPRPTGQPPARRRSAATPQGPRSRRRPGHPKESGE
jgi:purine-binding chemotaxis protein CheW